MQNENTKNGHEMHVLDIFLEMLASGKPLLPLDAIVSLYSGEPLRIPRQDAPLSKFVSALICIAKGIWREDLQTGITELPFDDWLVLHLNFKTLVPPVWPNHKGWSEALQLLRIACELPQFAPISKAEAR